MSKLFKENLEYSGVIISLWMDLYSTIVWPPAEKDNSDSVRIFFSREKHSSAAAGNILIISIS